MSELDLLYNEIMMMDDENNALREELDKWKNIATVLSVKLKTAIGALEYYNDNAYDCGPAKNALIAIEGE